MKTVSKIRLEAPEKKNKAGRSRNKARDEKAGFEVGKFTREVSLRDSNARGVYNRIPGLGAGELLILDFGFWTGGKDFQTLKPES